METLTHFFIEVMKTCSFVNPEVTKWHIELAALFKSQSVAFSPILLPRLLTAFGVLIRSGQEAQDTLSFVMDCLIDSFTSYSPYRNELPVASLLCLGQFCYKLPLDHAVFKRILVIPITLLAIADPVLFPVVVNVLDCAITAISNSKAFNECTSLEDYFNKYCRDEKTDPIITKFEKLTGISFRTHFSFAISTLLIKGLTMNQTKECAARICSSLINVCTKVSTNMADILGFVCALIPYNYEQIKSILGDNYNLFTEDNFSHPYSALLFTRYLLTVVQNVELDSDKILIYSILKDAFKKVPEVFEPIYPDVMPRVIQVYNQATNPRIAEVSLALINTMMGDSDESFTFSSTGVDETKDKLKDIFFTGINRAGSFKTINEQTRTECLTLVLEFIKNCFDNTGGYRKKDQPKKVQQIGEQSK